MFLRPDPLGLRLHSCEARISGEPWGRVGGARRSRADPECGYSTPSSRPRMRLPDCRGCSTLSSRPKMRSLEALEQTQNAATRRSRADPEWGCSIVGAARRSRADPECGHSKPSSRPRMWFLDTLGMMRSTYHALPVGPLCWSQSMQADFDRHVRQHHADKADDNHLLRDVFSRRPDGRKRRKARSRCSL